MGAVTDTDETFFAQFPSRQTCIRNARPGEQDDEFRTLGPHATDRRRMLVWKVPKDNAMMEWRGKLIRLPFLAYADEEIRNEDTEGLRLLGEIMNGAAKQQGVGPVRV